MAKSDVKISTLGGVFQPPVMNCKRNFVRENKQSLKDLQKVATEKQSTNRRKLTQKVEKQKSQFSMNGRSLGQRVLQSHQHEQTKPILRRESNRIPSRDGNNHLDGCTNSVTQLEHTPSIKSCLSKAESCDKEIQTEDIKDEEFLYDALKKCSINDTNLSNGPIYDTNSNNQLGENNKLSDDKAEGLEQRYVNNRTIDDEDQRFGLRSKTRMSQHDSNQMHNKNDYNYRSDNLASDSQTDLQPQLSARSQHSIQSINDKYLQEKYRDADGMSTQSRGTGRSTLSHRSLASKQSSGCLHKLGSKEDVKLPAYLEREKREKELQRLRERDHDPFCPPGHIALSEAERLKALYGAEKKYQSLVLELNRMPMTNETLRLRNRKTEIEKELVAIESEIRSFSKPKVYLKQE